MDIPCLASAIVEITEIFTKITQIITTIQDTSLVMSIDY